MKKLLIILAILMPLLTAIPVQAQGTDQPCDIFDSRVTCYKELSPLQDPNGESPKKNDFADYLNTIYRIGIGACFVLGVIMFTIAGIEYIVSESMNTKGQAKSRIQNALIGLAIALVSYILLKTINPDLLKIVNIDTSVQATQNR